MKNKSFCHVVAMVCVMMLSMASCEKMNVTKDDIGGKDEANVHLSVASFEQVPFSATRAAVADVCSRISFLVYDKDGNRIRKEDQQQADENFGHASFMLGSGRYFLVVTAHSGQGNPTSTNAQKIGFTNKTGFTDTFLYADSLIVGDTDVARSLVLRRIVAMVRLIPSDPIPARADSISFYYTGGSGTFDATAGGWGVVNSEQTQYLALSHAEEKFDLYTIPHEGEDQALKVRVATYRGNTGDLSLVSDCEITGIPIKRNHITTCRGFMFSPVYKQDFTISIDALWDNDSIDFYF